MHIIITKLLKNANEFKYDMKREKYSRENSVYLLRSTEGFRSEFLLDLTDFKYGKDDQFTQFQ